MTSPDGSTWWCPECGILFWLFTVVLTGYSNRNPLELGIGSGEVVTTVMTIAGAFSQVHFFCGTVVGTDVLVPVDPVLGTSAETLTDPFGAVVVPRLMTTPFL